MATSSRTHCEAEGWDDLDQQQDADVVVEGEEDNGQDGGKRKVAQEDRRPVEHDQCPLGGVRFSQAAGRQQAGDGGARQPADTGGLTQEGASVATSVSGSQGTSTRMMAFPVEVSTLTCQTGDACTIPPSLTDARAESTGLQAAPQQHTAQGVSALVTPGARADSAIPQSQNTEAASILGTSEQGKQPQVSKTSSEDAVPVDPEPTAGKGESAAEPCDEATQVVTAGEEREMGSGKRELYRQDSPPPPSHTADLDGRISVDTLGQETEGWPQPEEQQQVTDTPLLPQSPQAGGSEQEEVVVVTSVSRADGPEGSRFAVNPESSLDRECGDVQAISEGALHSQPTGSTVQHASSAHPTRGSQSRPTGRLDSALVQQVSRRLEELMLQGQLLGHCCKHLQGGALYPGCGATCQAGGVPWRADVQPPSCDVPDVQPPSYDEPDVQPPSYDEPEPGPAERELPCRVRDEEGVIDLQYARQVRRRRWMCVACWEREKNVRMKPCDHECLCWDCFKEPAFCLQRPLHCPVCHCTCSGIQPSPGLLAQILQESQLN